MGAGSLGFSILRTSYAAAEMRVIRLKIGFAVVDFEPFRYRLEKALKRSDGAKGGQLAYDPMFGTLTGPMAFGAPLFKILILQALYGMSDDQAEFQIRDRLTFIRFLGLGLATRCRMPRQSGCSASNSPGPVQSRSCSPGSTSWTPRSTA